MAQDVFRIVKIISDYQIVINGGRGNGIQKDDVFEIFEEGEKVVDPETGVTLGTLDYVKDTVTAATVLPNMTVCEGERSASFALSSVLGEALSAYSVSVGLNVDPEEISGGYENVNKRIRIGDLVRVVEKTEDNKKNSD